MCALSSPNTVTVPRSVWFAQRSLLLDAGLRPVWVRMADLLGAHALAAALARVRTTGELEDLLLQLAALVNACPAHERRLVLRCGQGAVQ